MLNILTFCVGVLPSSKIKNLLFRLLGHLVENSATIKPIIIWKCKDIVVEENAILGALSVFRDLECLHLESNAKIGQLNWISASKLLAGLGAPSKLIMSRDSVITNRHYLDVSGGVTIGEASAITGVRSTFITHGVSYETNEQGWKGIAIEHHNLIGSNSILIPGVRTNPYSIYGMGALIAGESKESYKLFLNRPSEPKKSLNSKSRYFFN